MERDYSNFSFLNNLFTDFLGGCINSYSTNDVYKLVIQESLSLAMMMIAILTKVRWESV